LPPNPRRIAPRICSDLIFDRSAEDMPKEPGAALDALADLIVGKMDDLIEERERLWRLAHESNQGAMA
jgi:hypothetical protein